MARPGTFAGFVFDPEVFSGYMEEAPTWSNAILASGILRTDPTIMNLIGTEGNVATLPFYKPISIEEYEPLNNDGLTDNTPESISGEKQTAMLIQRMKAWKEQDFTKEMTSADPMRYIANSNSEYYGQVWERELMNIANAVIQVPGLESHITDLSNPDAADADDLEKKNMVNETTLIYAKQAAFGDMANNPNSVGLIAMHSMIWARYQSLGLVEYNKFTIGDTIQREVQLPIINGMVPVVTDRYTIDITGDIPVYKTWIYGTGAFLESDKTNYEDPYYVDYDPETRAGIRKLYTKQGKVLHPNGVSIKSNKIAEESPTLAELGDTSNWELAYNTKNVRIGLIKSNFSKDIA